MPCHPVIFFAIQVDPRTLATSNQFGGWGGWGSKMILMQAEVIAGVIPIARY